MILFNIPAVSCSDHPLDRYSFRSNSRKITVHRHFLWKIDDDGKMMDEFLTRHTAPQFVRFLIVFHVSMAAVLSRFSHPTVTGRKTQEERAMVQQEPRQLTVFHFVEPSADSCLLHDSSLLFPLWIHPPLDDDSLLTPCKDPGNRASCQRFHKDVS